MQRDGVVLLAAAMVLVALVLAAVALADVAPPDEIGRMTYRQAA